MARLIVPPPPSSDDPNLFREEYGPTGSTRRIYTGPRSMPRLVDLPGSRGNTANASARGESIGGPLPTRGNPQPRNPNFFTGNPQHTISSNTGAISNTYPQQNPIQQKATQDYSRIMDMYQGLLNRTPGSRVRERLNPVQAETFTPEEFKYEEDPRLTGAVTGLEDLAKTGGYSSEDIANLRARGISPIRAVYANAQRNLERQKNLSGGYSPNTGAVSAKMAREMSELISGKTTDVNAGIAEQVARGKQQAAPQLADLLKQISESKNRVGERNVESRNLAGQRNIDARSRADEINRANQLREQELGLGEEQADINRILESIKGMTSLFGQNNQLADQFSQNILGNRKLDLEGQELEQRGGLGLIDAYLRGRS